MRAGWILAAALAFGASAALAQPAAPRSRVWSDGSLDIWAGQRVTVRLSQDGRPEIVSAIAASEAEARPPKPGQGGFDDPPEGTLVLLVGRDGDLLRLKVESGLGKALDYRVQLLTEAGVDNIVLRPAKACTALPLLTSYEQWPQQAQTGVRLYDFRTRDTNEVVCSEPTQYPRPRPAPAK